MLCLACGIPAVDLCDPCRSRLRRSPPRSIAGVVVESAFVHRGPATSLVHALKYGRSLAAGRFLAMHMIDGVPVDASCLVPLPRVLVRRVKYGIDPAVVLARQLSASTELPVLDVVRAPVWWPKRAGTPASRRRSVPFRIIGDIPEGAVLVDDVVTTGGTIASTVGAAAERFSVVTATAAGTMDSRAETYPRAGGGVAQGPS